ncbi:MAG TPA: YbaB/EbfC family nucleoid-associated protein [Brevefilum fermentans]|nr:YbaB/EbfC family nucleoid-associated protein [Brevefilum fermentans]
MAKGYNRPRQSKGVGGGGMMTQFQQMQEQMAQAQAELADETVTATVGGGAIRVTMTGDQVCKSVEILPDLLEDIDAEMLQDLITSGVNAALDQSLELASQKMSPFTNMLGGLGLG